MQPCRSEGLKVDQFLTICWRAPFSEFMQISRSLVPPDRLTVTAAAILQVCWMSTVGMYCACASAQPPMKPTIAAAAAMIEQSRGQAVARSAVEIEAVRIRASLGFPPVTRSLGGRIAQSAIREKIDRRRAAAG